MTVSVALKLSFQEGDVTPWIPTPAEGNDTVLPVEVVRVVARVLRKQLDARNPSSIATPLTHNPYPYP